MKNIKLYTDGACSGNPGRGGYGAIAIDENGNVITEARKGFRLTTNNRMEILAAAAGLQDSYWRLVRLHATSERDTDIKVTVFSDSQLVVNTMEKGWSRNSNKDLWKKLDEAVALYDGNVTFVKVKGHSNDRMNNKVDSIAVEQSLPENATNIDTVYESINSYGDSDIFDGPETNEPTIKNIYLLYNDQPERRKIEVSLSNGTIVNIVGIHGGFEQFNCTQREAAITVGIATKFCGWLNGKKL